MQRCSRGSHIWACNDACEHLKPARSGHIWACNDACKHLKLAWSFALLQVECTCQHACSAAAACPCLHSSPRPSSSSCGRLVRSAHATTTSIDPDTPPLLLKAHAIGTCTQTASPLTTLGRQDLLCTCPARQAGKRSHYASADAFQRLPEPWVRKVVPGDSGETIVHKECLR